MPRRRNKSSIFSDSGKTAVKLEDTSSALEKSSGFLENAVSSTSHDDLTASTVKSEVDSSSLNDTLDPDVNPINPFDPAPETISAPPDYSKSIDLPKENTNFSALLDFKDRLVIRDVEVQNFKSYYGTHTIGPFHSTFTSVIGPNGSGKSNIIDALLFIFGRNAKKIRLEKLSELIHNSSAHPDVSYASVTVNFVRLENANSDALSNEKFHRTIDNVREVPGSELKVKREVFRSGTTQYYINGKKRTQKDVIERLIKEGIDLEHNRFLILQGEVEQIALMKPKAEKEGEEGLLEYLDDLIGTNEFIGRISDATRLCESLQIERLEALDKKKVLLSEREALDDAKNSTLAFVTKDNHLQKTLIAMCQLRMQSIDEKLAEPRRILQEADKRIELIKKDVESKLEEKKSAENTLTERKKDLSAALSNQNRLREKKQSIDADVEKSKSSEEEQGKKCKKLQDQLHKASEDLQKAEIQQQDAEREGAIHQENLKEAADRVQTLQTELEKKLEEIQPIIIPLRKKLEEKKILCAPFEQAVVERTEEVNTIKSNLTAIEQKKIQQHEEIRKLESTLQLNKERMSHIEERLRQAEDSEQNDEIQKCQDDVAEAARKKYTINGSIQELKNMVRENEAHDRVTEFLLAQRSLKGYYGTLRQLGRIDEEYDIAAGVASNAWGFHVVDNPETAREALRLLKVNNIGRVTLMVLSEIEKQMKERMNRPFKCQNMKAKRLFDLIVPTAETYRCAFYQAVRDTLVVSNLAEAREAAFHSGSQRHRVVTLKGELIEPSGTITGGGASPKGAKLKAARSPQNLSSAKAELERLQPMLIQAVEEERRAQEMLNNLRRNRHTISPQEKKSLRLECSQLSAVIENDSSQREFLLGELEKGAIQNKQTRSLLLSQLEEAQGLLEKSQKDRLAHYGEVELLNKEIDEAGGPHYQSILSELKEKQNLHESEEHAARESRKLAQKLRATQERKRKDIADLEEKLRELQTDEASSEAKHRLSLYLKQQEDAASDLRQAEENVQSVQKDLDSVKALLPKLGAELLETQKRLDDETRYRQTEAVKIADHLQELEKFEQKIQGCEEKIRENADQYGMETLQLERNTEGEDDEGAEDSASKAEEDDDDEEDDEDEDEEDEEENDEDIDETDNEEEELEKRNDGESEEEEEGNSATASSKKKSTLLSDQGSRRNRKRPRAKLSAFSKGKKSNNASSNGGASKKKEFSRDALRTMSFRLSPEALSGCDYDRLVHLGKALRDETQRLHNDIDFRAVALWRERDQAYRRALEDYESKRLAFDDAENKLNVLKNERKEIFMQYFNLIQKKLKEVYQLLTHGGDADMELVDLNDPFEGIYFIVRPPKKSWKQISNLSGGEKTLSSLALIFSLHFIKPTPIYVMDEIDAALDYRNVTIVANYVLNQAVGAQFIIISLRNHMFELAHQLVGVCKVKDMTRTLVLHPRKFQENVQLALRALAMRKKERESQGESAPKQDVLLSPGSSCKRPLLPSINDKLEALAESSHLSHECCSDSHRLSENARRNIEFVDPAEKENQNINF